MYWAMSWLKPNKLYIFNRINKYNRLSPKENINKYNTMEAQFAV